MVKTCADCYFCRVKLSENKVWCELGMWGKYPRLRDVVVWEDKAGYTFLDRARKRKQYWISVNKCPHFQDMTEEEECVVNVGQK